MCGLQKHQVSENRSFSTMFIVRALKATRSSPRRSLPMPRNALGRGLGALIRELEPKSSPEPAPIHPHATNAPRDRKSTRLNSSHQIISYAVFCLKKKNTAHHVISHADFCLKKKHDIKTIHDQHASRKEPVGSSI